MAHATCTVAGCEKPHRCKGYCALHYDRVRRTGSPDLPNRPKKVCAVDECGRAHWSRGYCEAHYGRLLKHGDVRAHIPLRDLPTADQRDDIVARILARCVQTERGCIEWTGTCVPNGYGTISWHSRSWVVHRAMWTAKVGEIPTGDEWTLDHLCFNRRCVNVAHLELVTRIENSRRGGGLPRAQSANKIRNAETCPNGHARTPENTSRSPKGYRVCLTCRKEQWAKKAPAIYARRKAERAAKRAT